VWITGHFSDVCGQGANNRLPGSSRPKSEVVPDLPIALGLCRPVPNMSSQPINQKGAHELDQELYEEVGEHSAS
jgi:hypothetical protein